MSSTPAGIKDFSGCWTSETVSRAAPRAGNINSWPAAAKLSVFAVVSTHLKI
ncbi:MAG: hypothetical protein QXJ56_06060 [Ignisphaera sp.]